MLPKAREQPCDQQGRSDDTSTSSSDPFAAVEFPGGAAGRQRATDNDKRKHTGQEMFSCTTLSTRMGKDYYMKSDGCMDYGFSRCVCV